MAGARRQVFSCRIGYLGIAEGRGQLRKMAELKLGGTYQVRGDLILFPSSFLLSSICFLNWLDRE